jgi:hypothetical protein
MDKRLCEFVASMERRRGGGAKLSATVPEPPSFDGLAPEAVRVVPFEFATPRPDVLLAGGELTLAWAFRREADGNGREGWWASAVVPQSSEQAAGVQDADAAGIVRRTIDPAASGPAAPGEPRWLLFVRAKPRQLEAAMPPLFPFMHDWRSTLRWLEHFEVKLRAGKDGEAWGEASFRLSEQPPLPGTPGER